MKTLCAVFSFTALALAGTYAAAGPVPWAAEDYRSEFKLFTEAEAFDKAAWEALPPAAQETELQNAKAPAAERLAGITAWYEGAMRRWDTRALKGYTAAIKEKDLQAAELWLGRDAAKELAKKLRVVSAAVKKAPAEGLNAEDAAALAPYLTPEAVNDLRAMRTAAASAALQDKKAAAPKTSSGASLEKFSASLPAGDPAAMAKFFDGSNARGDAAVNFSGGAQGNKSAPAGAALTNTAPVTARAQQPKAAVPVPPQQQKSAQPEKSSAWTSDAYGFTVTANGRTATYRDQRQAEAAIRALPDGSISKIILYGHGSPGMQTVGPATYDSESTAAMLKGKMAPGGVVQFSGCNTASIGGATLNPAVGLSMITRRLLYFSLPYWQDRADGVPAAQAKEQWEKGWDADLARDTSLNMRGAVVCGYRTFGLVPGRLPGLTRVIGNQEATTPGYVAGKKACYKDGKEVPAQ
ncbi:MAG: hypothetical protein ACYC2I_13515 [Elusimicrobiales bacterium]